MNERMLDSMIFLWIILIILVIIRFQENNKIEDSRKSLKALDILNQRLANGEITEDEYIRKIKVLS